MPFKSELDRRKAEFYTLGRTMMRVMLSSIVQKEKIKMGLIFINDKEHIEEAFQKIKVYYNKEIVDIVYDLINEEDPDIIQKKIDKLSYEYIEDKERLLSKLVEQKTKKELVDITDANIE